MIVLAALYLPGLFKAKPKFADIYTVSLVNIAEPVAAPPSAKPQASAPTPAKKIQESAPPPPAPAPPKAKKEAPIAEIPPKAEPEPVPTAAPQKAISLKPLKQKIIKEVKEPEVTPKKSDQDLKKVQKLADALREESVLTERARIAQEALEQERRVLTQSNKGRMAQSTESTAGPQTNAPAQTVGGSNTLLENQYNAAIANRLQQFWAIPETLQKNPNLTSVVVITIKIDGDIANMVFESKSGDPLFDQYVSKTIEKANPLPPIPPALKKQRYEVGVRFKPGSIE